nr:HAMP domain-containing sensor histidine kinase [Sedimentibacter sp.]
MKKNYIKPITVFIFIIVITFSLCVIINDSFGTLKSGQVLSPRHENTVYSLTGYRLDTNTRKYYFDIVVEDINQPLSLIYGFIPEDIYANGIVVAHSANFNLSNFSSVTIDSSLFNKETNTLNLEFYSKDNPYNQPVYITTVNGAANALSTYYMTFAFNLGITFLMSLYGWSLYFNKRTEKYLLWFSIYTGALTLWSLGSLLLGIGFDFIRPLVSHAYGWCALLDVIISCKMFNTKLPGHFDRLLSRNGVIILLLVWASVETLLPKTFRDYYFLFFFSIAALIYACANHRKGSYMLLAGQTISLGMRLVVTVSPVMMNQISYLLRVLRYSKIFNLPFAICCMFLINRLFAEKFSESEALAEQLEQTNQALETKVLERTSALKDQQRQKNTFMMNVFHDLRTPLFVLRGCTERINTFPQHLTHELPVMEERLDFIQHLVDDLFLMAKLEDKQVILETERVPLGSLLSRVVTACLVVSEKKDIALEYNIIDDCVTWGDEFRLEQAFQNLITNAIYYTKTGGTVCVELKSFDNVAFISVTDTGVGISPEDLDKIFDRYYRVSGKDKHQSSGLGLSIAQEIIQQHNGKITVKSTVGIGTAFTLQLPVIPQ